MSEIKWIKLSVDMFDDDKIRLLEKMPEGDTMIVIWCKLLTMAGKANHKGYIMLTENFPYTEDMLVTLIDRPQATVKMALGVFEKFGMLEFDTDENAFLLANWTKHQNIDGMEKQKQLSRERQKKYRNRKKQELLESPVDDNSKSNVTRNVTRNDEVTQSNAPRKKKEERRKEKEIKTTTTSKGETDKFNLYNKELSSVIQSYESFIGIFPTGLTEQVIDAIEEFGPELVAKSFDVAASKNKRNWSYVLGIHRNWRAEGIDSIQKLEASEVERSHERGEHNGKDEDSEYIKQLNASYKY